MVTYTIPVSFGVAVLMLVLEQAGTRPKVVHLVIR